MSLVKSEAEFTNSVFTYNYAVSGGSLSAESVSVISTFQGITATNNYASSEGGVIALRGEAKIAINTCTFASNTGNIASVLYFLGTLSKHSVKFGIQ